jgi:hypothetical protein
LIGNREDIDILIIHVTEKLIKIISIVINFINNVRLVGIAFGNISQFKVAPDKIAPRVKVRVG